VVAGPQHHQRAEHAVVGDPDPQLGAVGDHRLHQDLAETAAEPVGQPAVGGADLGRGMQIDFYRAGVGPGH
jgi:hypothetical protein